MLDISSLITYQSPLDDELLSGQSVGIYNADTIVTGTCLKTVFFNTGITVKPYCESLFVHRIVVFTDKYIYSNGNPIAKGDYFVSEYFSGIVAVKPYLVLVDGDTRCVIELLALSSDVYAVKQALTTQFLLEDKWFCVLRASGDALEKRVSPITRECSDDTYGFHQTVYNRTIKRSIVFDDSTNIIFNSSIGTTDSFLINTLFNVVADTWYDYVANEGTSLSGTVSVISSYNSYRFVYKLIPKDKKIYSTGGQYKYNFNGTLL